MSRIQALLGAEVPWTFMLVSFLYHYRDTYFERDCISLIRTAGDRSYVCEPVVDRGQEVFHAQGMFREIRLGAGPEGSAKVVFSTK